MIIGIDHVAIATDDLEGARSLFQLFGLEVVYREDIPEDGVRSEQLGTPNANIELLTASSETAPVARFLAKNGPALHHVCLRVDDLDATIALLQREGLRLVDPQPREDGQGRRVFLHPQSGHGVLMGLVQRGGA